MVLRYFDTDFMTYKENEILFVGNKKECIKYLFKEWSVDANEYKHNINLYSLFCNYLRNIQFSHKDFGNLTISQIYERCPDWDDATWNYINAEKLIFNKELVSIIGEPEEDIDKDELRDIYFDALGGDWEG